MFNGCIISRINYFIPRTSTTFFFCPNCIFMLINGKIVFFICQLSNIVFGGVDFAGFMFFFYLKNTSCII